jgi:hypothetical protein
MLLSGRRAVILGVGAWGALLVFATGSCASKRPVAMSGSAAAPGEQDRGALCGDVGGARACWGVDSAGEGCAGGVCSVPRSLPPGPAPPEGWRCDGMGQTRTCEERALNGAPWRCDAGQCAQDHPRMPDDGDWECVDMDGAVYCHGGRPAAAVVAGRPDRGWMCGPRGKGPPGERVCLDLAPDRPDEASLTECRFDYAQVAPVRRCKASSGARLGDACDDSRRCPSGASCVGERCLPPRPAPACWFDTDCDRGARCRWGTCVGGGA